MKIITSIVLVYICGLFLTQIYAQDRQHQMYGEATREVKMRYVYSLEQAQRLAYQQKKLIFFNCYADWAAPCLGMNQYVFSDQAFCDYMDKKFINLFVDMTSSEGKELAKQYNVKTYAYFLVLDYKGKVIQRISGGTKLPEFKEWVDLALDKKTSLAGCSEKYATGKYNKKDLHRYLRTLRVAGEDSLFRKLGKEYMAMMVPEEYPKKENWMFSYLNRDLKGEYYRYLVDHKAEFVKNIGEKSVNQYIEALISPDLLSYATGDAEYDVTHAEELKKEMETALLSDTCATAIIYQIGKLRGERKFIELLTYLNENGELLSQYGPIRSVIELSLNLPDINDKEREALVDYLHKASKREKGTASKRLATFAESMSKSNKGITFTHVPFDELLARAKAEKKVLFIDCFTSWCGPCRAMASNVFTLPQVGEYFNTYFVNAKIDMEKGEGKDLAKRYEVHAFPTLIFLDSEGNVIEKAVGFKQASQLLETAKGVIKRINAN